MTRMVRIRRFDTATSLSNKPAIYAYRSHDFEKRMRLCKVANTNDNFTIDSWWGLLSRNRAIIHSADVAFRDTDVLCD